MLAPDVIGLAIFVFLPVIIAFYVSLHRWNALEAMQFIGFKNYLTLMKDTSWWSSVLITLKYTVMFVPMVYFLSLLLAVFINSIPGKLQQFFRTVYFVPFSISTVVVAIIYIAALKDIPQSYYEAAKIDGCSSFEIFLKIFVPLSKPISITPIIILFFVLQKNLVEGIKMSGIK